MKKIWIFLLFVYVILCCSSNAFADATVSNDTINLVSKNAFAYDIRLDMAEERSALVTYRLNGISYKVVVQAWDATGTTLLKEVPGTLYPNGNRILFNFDGIDIGTEVLFKVKVYSKRVDAPTLIVDEFTDNGAWSFCAPYGVSANNWPFSDTFGRLAVTESSFDETVTISCPDHHVSKGISYRNNSYDGIGVGLYSFDPRMQPILNRNNEYGFDGEQFLNGATGFDFKRVKYSDDGRLFVARQTTERASIWEFNPDNLNHYPNDVFGRGGLNTKNGWVYSHVEESTVSGESDLYDNFMAGPGVAFDVIGAGENLKLVVGTFEYKTELVKDASDKIDGYVAKTATPLIELYPDANDEERRWYTRIDVYELGKRYIIEKTELKYEGVTIVRDDWKWPIWNIFGKYSDVPTREEAQPDMSLGVGAHFNNHQSFNVTFGADGNSVMASQYCNNPVNTDIAIGQTSYIRIDIDTEMGVSGTKKSYTEINPEGAAIAWNKTRTLVAKTIGGGKVGVFTAENQDSYNESDAKWVFNPGLGTSIDAMSFDYGHNLYFVSQKGSKFLSYALPRESDEFSDINVNTEADTIITPTKLYYTLLAENVQNVKAKGVITIAEPDKWSSVVTWDAPATGLVDYYDVYYKRSYIDENGVVHATDWTFLEMVGDEDFTPDDIELSVSQNGIYNEKDANGVPYRTIYNYKVVPHFTTGILIDKDNESNDLVIYEQSIPVDIEIKQQQDDAGRYSFNLELNVTPKSHLFDMVSFDDVKAIDMVNTYTIVVSEEVAELLNNATMIENGSKFVKGNVTVADGAEILDLNNVWFMQVSAPVLDGNATTVSEKSMPSVVFHNVDPTKDYKFNVYVTSGIAEDMAIDGWPFFDFVMAESSVFNMVIPGTGYSFNDMSVVRLEDPNPVETANIDMPIGSHRKVGVLDVPTDPVTYEYINCVRTKNGAFEELNVTGEVVENWSIAYDLDLMVDDDQYATLTNEMNSSADSDGILGRVFADLSSLPVNYTTFVGADDRTYKRSKETTYSSVVKVRYTRNVIVAESQVSEANSITFDLNDYAKGLNVYNWDGILLTINPEKSSHYNENSGGYWMNHYDSSVKVEWENNDELYNLVGYHAYVDGRTCYGHYENGGYVWVKYHPAYVLTDEQLVRYGIADNKKVEIPAIGYDGTNDWSSLAEAEDKLPLYVHYVYATDGVIGNDVATVSVDMTADYPILVKSKPDVLMQNSRRAMSEEGTMSMDVFVVPAETVNISLSEDNRVETGVEEAQIGNFEFKIYPNPVNDVVTIVSSDKLGLVEIVSLDGRLVRKLDVEEEKISLNVEDINKGIYIVRVSSKTAIMLKQ